MAVMACKSCQIVQHLRITEGWKDSDAIEEQKQEKEKTRVRYSRPASDHNDIGMKRRGIVEQLMFSQPCRSNNFSDDFSVDRPAKNGTMT
jgi:hypothetical protein